MSPRSPEETEEFILDGMVFLLVIVDILILKMPAFGCAVLLYWGYNKFLYTQ